LHFFDRKNSKKLKIENFTSNVFFPWFFWSFEAIVCENRIRNEGGVLKNVIAILKKKSWHILGNSPMTS
jgi:hypothetical protein